MKEKSVIKIILDLVMTVLFAVLLFAYSTGLAFHEIMGLSILFFFGLHLILNRQWIVGISKKLFSGQIKSKTLFMYFLNAGVLIGVLVITVTGLMISTIILPQSTSNPSLLFAHKWTSYITAGFMSLHLALHGGYMVTSMKRIVANLKTTPVRRVFRGAFVMVMIVGFVYYNVISGLSHNANALSNTNDANNQSTQSSEVIAPNTTKKDEENDTMTSSENDEKGDTITSSEKAEKDDTLTSSESQPATISLSEFLSKLYCTLCPKHCPLSRPQCGKAASLIAQAKEDYQTLYGDE